MSKIASDRKAHFDSIENITIKDIKEMVNLLLLPFIAQT